MNKKVLYISYDGITDPLGQSQVLPYLQGLGQRGYQFTLISCEKAEVYALHKEAVSRVCQTANIQWRPLVYTKKPPLLSTMYDLLKIRNLAFRLHRQINFSAVHCRSYIAALVGLEFKQKLGIPFIFDMRGFWADERMDGKIWSAENRIHRMLFRFFKKKEQAFFTHADAVISLTEGGKREILSREDVDQNTPIFVIPCCADLDLFSPERVNEVEAQKLKKKLGFDQNDFILIYLGSIGTWYCLEEMLLFFRQLKKRNSRAKLLLITREPRHEIIKMARKMSIPQLSLIIRPAMRREVPMYLSLAHCGLFFIKPTYSKIASSPTKQAEMMAMGLPLICNDIGDTGKLVREHQIGVALNNFSSGEFARALIKLPELRKLSRQAIRVVAEREFSLEKGVLRYDEVYSQVLSPELKYA